MFTLDAWGALYSRKTTFRVVENRCLQFVESIFVNLPQFAKSGLKESLKRFFGIFLYIFLDILVWYRAFFCFYECSLHCSTFDGGAIETSKEQLDKIMMSKN